MSIVSIVNDLCERGQNYPTFWFTHYYSFCAVVVLYVYTIQSRIEPTEIWRPYFQAAERCQSQISSLKAVKDSFAQRYSIVLEELRLEALKQITQMPPIPRNNDSDPERDQDTEVAHTILRLSENHQLDANAVPNDNIQVGNGNSNAMVVTQTPHIFEGLQSGLPTTNSFEFAPSVIGASPSSMTGGEATGWGEFDSFVTAGIGSLESHFLDGLQDIDQADNWDFSASLDPNLNIGPGP